MINLQYRGSLYIALSAFFFGTYGIWSRLMGESFGEFSQAWTRALIILLFMIPVGFFFKQYKKIDKNDWKWFAIIALAGGLNQAPYYYGFQRLSVGTATLIFYVCLTLGAFIIGRFFFHEKLHTTHWASLGLAVIGLLLLYQFTLTPDQLLPLFTTILAGFMGATTVVFSKKLTGEYTEVQVLTGTFITMFLTNVLLSYTLKEHLPSFTITTAWTAQLGYALAMVLANLSVVAGFKYVQPSIGGLIGLLEILFGMVFGLLFFGETMSAWGVVGSGMILIATMLPSIKFSQHT